MQLNNGLNPSIFEICTRDECSARACDAVSFVLPGDVDFPYGVHAVWLRGS